MEVNISELFEKLEKEEKEHKQLSNDYSKNKDEVAANYELGWAEGLQEARNIIADHCE